MALQLNHNQITWMAEASLAGLNNLVSLFLNDNQLEYFNYEALSYMQLIVYLNLRGTGVLQLQRDFALYWR